MTAAAAFDQAGALLDLDDGLVKLVAYTLVSVRRGAERPMPGAFGAGTVVVPEPMSGESFNLWMIDRYLRSLTPEERSAVQPDLKFLRVNWVVSRRWPRESLGRERRELETLDEIRDRLAGPAPIEPGLGAYRHLVAQVEAHRALLSAWRQGAQSLGGEPARFLAGALAAGREAGAFPTTAVTASELALAFAMGERQVYDGQVLDRFAGRSSGRIVPYPRGGGEGGPAPRLFRVWERAARAGHGPVQRTTISEGDYREPASVVDLASAGADLTVNLHRPGLGFVSWASNTRQGRQEMPMLGYPLGAGRMLWLAQLMSEELTPLMPGVFLVFLQWPGAWEGRQGLFLVTEAVAIDFAARRTGLAGDTLWKGFFEEATAWT